MPIICIIFIFEISIFFYNNFVQIIANIPILTLQILTNANILLAGFLLIENHAVNAMAPTMLPIR